MSSPLLLDGDPTRLPRGRHALSREEVSASQRRRLLHAVTEEVGEFGYSATTATRVFRRAGVSSRAFYEHFADVQDCFLSAYDECVRTTNRVLAEIEVASSSAPVGRFDALLGAYLQLLADHPNVARTFLVEIYSAGPAARARRLAVHQQFVDSVHHVLVPDRRRAGYDRVGVEALVDSIVFKVTRAVLADTLQTDRRSIRREILEVTSRLFPSRGRVGAR